MFYVFYNAAFVLIFQGYSLQHWDMNVDSSESVFFILRFSLRE